MVVAMILLLLLVQILIENRLTNTLLKSGCTLLVFPFLSLFVKDRYLRSCKSLVLPFLSDSSFFGCLSDLAGSVNFLT